jgi:Ala-tRNA(Pro) deacylase
MMRAPLVNYHPLVNSRTTAIRPADLLRFLDATGHPPAVVDLGPATAAD